MIYDPGVFIPARTSGRGRSGRLGGYVIVHGEANKRNRSWFDDDLRGWTDDQGRRHIQMPDGCPDDKGIHRWMADEEESEEEQQVYQVRERARTMNVQRHGEPRRTYTPLALVLPASHAPVRDDGAQRTYHGPVTGAEEGCTPSDPHHRGQCASSLAVFRRC